MADEKELTHIERELVLQYLRDDNVPVTVTLEEKPVPQELDLSGGKLEPPVDGERLPASAIFPVAIPAQQLTVLNQGIILLKNATREVAPFIGKAVRVQFYFHRLGLYFITTMQECSQGLAIVVPRSIRRMEEKASAPQFDVTATLSYQARGAAQAISIDCVPAPGYLPLSPQRWGDIPPEKQAAAKSLLERFVAQGREEQAASIGSGLHLMAVCRYLVCPVAWDAAPVAGAFRPLRLLSVDERRLVVASPGDDPRLVEQDAYTARLSLTLPGNAVFRRTVTVRGRMDNCYRGGDCPDACYVFTYDAIQEEDARFLYERLNGRQTG